MAQKVKPGKKPGGGRSTREQANSLDLEQVREHFDALHNTQDEQDEANATFRGRINRIYDKACEKLDVSKEALKLVYQEERGQRKKAAKAAKMDTRGRESMARFGAALGDTPMGEWASRMAKVAPALNEAETTTKKAPKAKKAKASNVVPLKKPDAKPAEGATA